jgi:hypothetical protein
VRLFAGSSQNVLLVCAFDLFLFALILAYLPPISYLLLKTKMSSDEEKQDELDDDDEFDEDEDDDDDDDEEEEDSEEEEDGPPKKKKKAATPMGARFFLDDQAEVENESEEDEDELEGEGLWKECAKPKTVSPLPEGFVEPAADELPGHISRTPYRAFMPQDKSVEEIAAAIERRHQQYAAEEDFEVRIL